MLGMSQKFDSLLQLVNPNGTAGSQGATTDAYPHQPSHQPTTHHLPSQRQQGGRHLGSTPRAEYRSTRGDPRPQTYSDYVAHQLQQEDFTVPRSDHGKAMYPDIFVNNLAPKPYMFIERPGVNTMKKKLELRDSLPFNEYMAAYLRMIRDPRADQEHLNEFHVEHLQQVCEDSMKRDWPMVRRWSQATLDDIEKGKYGWEDRHQIQWERLNHAVLQVKHIPPTQPRQEQRDMCEIPCRDFNSMMGCINNRSHLGRNVQFVHVCSLCIAQTGDRAHHSAVACPRRDTGLQRGQYQMARASGPVQPQQQLLPTPKNL